MMYTNIIWLYDVNYVLQLSEYQQKLSEAESEVSQLRSQLASLEESKEKLQQVLDECGSQERHRENQIKLLQAQLSDKSEQLSTAEDKMQVNIIHIYNNNIIYAVEPLHKDCGEGL